MSNLPTTKTLLVNTITDPNTGALIELYPQVGFLDRLFPKPIVKIQYNQQMLFQEIKQALANYDCINAYIKNGTRFNSILFQFHYNYQTHAKHNIEVINGNEVIVSRAKSPNHDYMNASIELPLWGVSLHTMETHPILIIRNIQNPIIFTDNNTRKNIMVPEWYIQFNNHYEVNYFIDRLGLLLV